MISFDSQQAFSRNLGWISEAEARRLPSCRVAIAGLGGVGGNHLITLIRMGLSKFHIADFDQFELSNFNRQYGADTGTIGLKKSDVMTERALQINPLAEIRSFKEGVTERNMDQFLEGVDIYVDGLDVFQFDIRQSLFMRCRQLGIPAVTVAPIGMGASLINFIPGKMGFQEYFGLQPGDALNNFFKFIIGLSPSLIQLRSMVDTTYTDPLRQKVPSTPMGCSLASGVMGTEVLKILLGRKNVLAAPWCVHFDAYTNSVKKNYMLLGSRNPLFMLKVLMARRRLQALSQA